MGRIVLQKVSKKFGEIEVIPPLDLTIEDGEFAVFVGPSGCGKSTLLRLIAVLEDNTSGDIIIDGNTVTQVPPSKRGLAMVFQSYALYPHMTVYDNMAFSLKIAGFDRASIDQKVRAAADKLQLTNFLDRLPKALSGGQRQRVAIGRSIVRDPKVYLFDEPLSNLDAALRVATRIEIAQLKEQMPESTMIYVTHDQVEAMTLATRIVVLAGGGIAQVGTPLELYERPNSTFVAQFIGSPAMNLMAGKIVGTGDVTTLELAQGAGHVQSHYPSLPSDLGADVQVGIRPEDMVETADAAYAFEGKVDIVEALGEVTLLYFAKGASVQDAVIGKLQGIHADMRGNTVRLTADPAKIHVFRDGISLHHRDRPVFLPGVQPH